jgi:hypothetical protein
LIANACCKKISIFGTFPYSSDLLILFYRLAAPESKMIIFMAVVIHYTAAMPKWGSPAAPVFMGIVSIEDEPAPFHLGIAQVQTAPTRHLAFVKRKVHMFSRVSMEIVDP